MQKGLILVADSETSADILYASSFHAPDPFIYFSVKGEKAIIVSKMEYARAQSEVKKGVRVYCREDFTDNGEAIDTPTLIKSLTEKESIELWQAPGNFPLGLGDAIRQKGCRIKATNKSFFPRRRKKNQSEIREINLAMRVTEKAMAKAVEILGETQIKAKNKLIWRGETLTSEILRSELEVLIAGEGGNVSRTIVAGGTQGSEPHNIGSGTLFPNKPIVIDIFPRLVSSGYWGDMTRTFVKGKASKKVKQAFEAVKEARDKAKAAIRPDKSYSDIHTLATETMESHGFKTGEKKGKHFGFIHGLGHGLGLEIHESPRVYAKSKDIIHQGDVVTVEPGLYYPEWGGIRLEDLVVVTKNGCDCLTKFDTFLEIE